MSLHPIHFLFLALSSLAAAPVIHGLLQSRPRLLRWVEIVCLVVVLGIVLFHILPESLEAAGWSALPFVVAGLALPLLLERLSSRRLHATAHDVSLVIVLLGMSVHSMMDGAAIAMPQGAEHYLSWAVVAHRIPDGLFIWCMLFPRFGYKHPTLALVWVAATTVTGFVIGLLLLTDLEGNAVIGLFQAFVAGSLLHVIIGHRLFPHAHSHHAHEDTEKPEGAPKPTHTA